MNPDRRHAHLAAQSAIDASEKDFACGAIDEATRLDRVTDALASAYLIKDDPRWGSGFDGDAELWRQARELVVDAVARDGTFLDVGCPNGHLMECVAVWAAERGYRLVVYGLEHSTALARTARRRVPAWSDQIFEGDVRFFQSPRRFDYVRTGLEYVPAGQRAWLIERLLRDVVSPDGRLIVGPTSGGDFEEAKAKFETAGCPDPAISSVTDRLGKTHHVLWVERASVA
ncbi:MAG: hypothetical protein FJY97_18075 [candidate division Zixibacteria bacterium]|nr:hypothetical protein [candidate division Zixibacteria bacterium]